MWEGMKGNLITRSLSDSSRLSLIHLFIYLLIYNLFKDILIVRVKEMEEHLEKYLSLFLSIVGFTCLQSFT